MHYRTRRFTVLMSLGAGLEYYDFIIYSLMASYLGQLFFPSSDRTASLIQTFGAFSLGYIARPIGGVFFGSLGDRVGRKTTFLIVMFLMALSTLAIGLLPTSHQVGVLAPIALTLCRFLQGFSYGGEIPGAITIVSEQSPSHRKARQTSFLFSSVAIGALLATGIVHLLHVFLEEDQILSGGWRFPFLLGGALAWTTFLIRSQIQNFPENTRGADGLPIPVRSQFLDPIFTLFKNYRPALSSGLSLSLLSAAAVIYALYLPAHLHEYHGLKYSEIYAPNLMGLFASIFFLPCFGAIGDRVGARRLYLIAGGCFVFLMPFLFMLLEHRSSMSLSLFFCLYQFFVSALVASYLPVLTSRFPTHLRYTAVAVCYNLAYLMASVLPSLTSYCIRQGLSPHNAHVVLISIGAVSLLRELRPVTLDRYKACYFSRYETE